MNKYNDKKNDSFKTRYKLFLFEMAFSGLTAQELVKKKDINDFKNFVIDKGLIKAYAANYYQKDYDEKVEYKYKKLTVDKIWQNMSFERNNLFQLIEYKYRKNISEEYLTFYDTLKKSYEDIFKNTFPKDKFDKMIKSKKCSYCGISEADISFLGEEGNLYNKRSETRGYTLEIDRKEANDEYTEKNCCMSCYWCNNAKTDEFSVKEFEEIARGINKVWEKRLGKKIVFPTEVYKRKE